MAHTRLALEPSSPSHRLLAVALGRLLVVGASVALVFFVLLREGHDFAWGRSSLLSAGMGFVALISSVLQIAWWRQHRAPRGWVMVQALVDQALVTGIVYLSGGAGSGATSLYGVTCFAAGLLLGVPGAVASAMAGGVFYSLTVLLMQASILPLPTDQPGAARVFAADQTTYYLVVNVVMLALVALLVSYLLERLESASGALLLERRRANQAERMAEMGRLAAGLAHEIRNPLSSIGSSIQILQEGLDSDEDKELCSIVLRESSRLNELVSDMVDLARPRQPALELVDVGRVLDDVVELAGVSGRAQADVMVSRLGAVHAWIKADPGQLRQLVWNLIRNAVQASASGGEVRVHLDAKTHVVLTVEDDGIGIDSEDQSQLFDAFFSTRSHGTGVGLAVVKRIVDDHGFLIAVESSAGEGAAFKVDMGLAQAN